MQKALIVLGPTASGKTDFAYQISSQIESVLVNADSRQVYRGLTIITGKDLPEGSSFQVDTQLSEMFQGFSVGSYTLPESQIYLLDVVNPAQVFSVNEYSILVQEVLLKIQNQQKLPIIVGGSHFYIKALVDGIDTLAIPQNDVLRETLTQVSVLVLQEKLRSLNEVRFRSMNDSDKQNHRRLIRAIEVEEWKRNNSVSKVTPVLHDYDVLQIGLVAPLEYLRKKIDERVEKRIQQGAMEEAEKLYQDFGTLSNNVKTANGYMQLFEYFQGKVNQTQAIQNWKYSEYHNAKKQLTWLKSDPRITPVDSTNPTALQKAIQHICAWYRT